MDWFVHDCSLDGQYSTATEFIEVLTELMRLRVNSAIVLQGVRCSRAIGSQPVVQRQTFSQVISSSTDRNLRNYVLKWITSEGPFLDDERENIADDYFEYKGTDVTDEGAGEAVRRILNGKLAMTFSFEKGGSDYSPLSIDHGLPEDRLGKIAVENVWTIAGLRTAAMAALPRVINWNQMIEQARVRFPLLHFADNLMDYLQRETFTF